MELGWLLIVCPHHPLDFIRSRETAFPSTWNPPRKGASSNGRERHFPEVERYGREVIAKTVVFRSHARLANHAALLVASVLFFPDLRHSILWLRVRPSGVMPTGI